MATLSAPSIGKQLLTAEEFAALPEPADGSKQELVRGEVVTMPPPSFAHGEAQGNTYMLLKAFARSAKLGRVTTETGMRTERDPDTVRGPDVAFWSYERIPADTKPEVYPNVSADLAVEVLSPSNTRKGMAAKVREYFTSGVRMVWLIDPDDQTVTVYRGPGNGTVLWSDATLTAEDVLPGFTVRVSEFFA